MRETNPISVAQSSNNIFQELGFESQEAANLQIRAKLMLDLKKRIQSNHWTIAQAAEQLNEPEAILRNLMSSAIEQFSVDQLLMLLMKAGMEIKVEIAPMVVYRIPSCIVQHVYRAGQDGWRLSTLAPTSQRGRP